MPDLVEYRITFGVRYADEPHPLFLPAHPDGWVAVLAVSEDAARRLVHARIGNAWAFIYQPGHPGYPASAGRHYKRGELGRWATADVRPADAGPVASWPAQVAALQAQVAAALAIHRPEHGVYCGHCIGSDEEAIPWPCPTAQALGVTA